MYNKNIYRVQDLLCNLIFLTSKEIISQKEPDLEDWSVKLLEDFGFDLDLRVIVALTLIDICIEHYSSKRNEKILAL